MWSIKRNDSTGDTAFVSCLLPAKQMAKWPSILTDVPTSSFVVPIHFNVNAPKSKYNRFGKRLLCNQAN